jgi:TonB-dependent receptor
MQTCSSSLVRPSFVLRLLVSLLAWALLTSPLAAQDARNGTVAGRIVDAATGAPVRGADIRLTGTDYRTTSNATGDFALRVPGGTYTAVVSYVGYEEKSAGITVAADGSTRIDFVLGDDVATLEAMVVTGIAQGQARAINQQRAAQNLTNLIASDAFGQFPDKNIADAVKRLPGVNVEREGGNPEGRYVTIRGMNADFNAVSVNGQRVTISNSGGTSRSVPLDVVSTKSAEQIELIKALTPDLDADGIGGAINIRTRTVWDRDGRFASADASYGYSRLLARYSSKFPLDPNYQEYSATFSDFVNADRTLGFAVTANFRDRPFVTQQFGTTGFWDKDRPLDRVRNPVDNQFYFIPRGLAFNDYHEHVKSTGATAALDWRPDADTKVELHVSYNHRDLSRGRQRQVIDYRFNRVDGAASAALPPQTSGDTFTQFVTTNSSRLERQVRDFGEIQKLLNISLNGEKRFGDLTARLYAGINDGRFEGDGDRDLIATFRWGDDLGEFRSSRNSYSIVGRDPHLPAFTTSRNRMAPDQFVVGNIDRSTLLFQDDEYTVGADLKWDRDIAGRPGFIKAGVKGRFRARDARQPDRFYSTLTSGTYWKLDEILDPSGARIFGSVLADYRADQSIDGNYDYGFFLDPKKVRAATDLLVGRGLLRQSTDARERTLVNSYTADEDVIATYAMAQATQGKLTALAGVRAEYTRVSFHTHQGVSTRGVYTTVTPVRGSNDYWDVGPGVHLRYEQSKSLLFRAAYTRTLARPSYRQLNPSSLLVTDPDDATLPTLTLGSTRLKPVRSHNFDVAAEYYLGSIGIFSVGVFAKEMENNVYRLTDTISMDINGTPGPVERRQFRNADGGSVHGVEVAYDQQLRFLPGPLAGLGVFANYTHASSKADGIFGRTVSTPLFGQVDRTFNGGLSYSAHGFNARLAYSWRSDYLTFNGLNLNPLLDEYLDSHGELDFSASYELTANFTIFVEASNLTNTPQKAYYGNRSLRPSYIEYRDWSGNIGIRWRL